jgi:hypothetical protein
VAGRVVHWATSSINARVTLLATGLNNLGIGSLIDFRLNAHMDETGLGIVGPTVSGHGADLAHTAAWITLGADLVAAAQALLGRLRT